MASVAKAYSEHSSASGSKQVGCLSAMARMQFIMDTASHATYEAANAVWSPVRKAMGLAMGDCVGTMGKNAMQVSGCALDAFPTPMTMDHPKGSHND